ncbi:MAG: protein kinase [Proteobacteria bacterium]|nr:protein kinase [Pseudomonadota bacterium]
MTRILLVEDEVIIRREVRRLLEHEGYEVVEAGAVAEALSHDLGSFDLIVSDQRLPGGDGTQLIEHAPGTPVLIMTSYATVRSAVSAIKQGAVDYIAKPFEPDELLDAIERIQREKARLTVDLARPDEAVIVPDEVQAADATITSLQNVADSLPSGAEHGNMNAPDKSKKFLGLSRYPVMNELGRGASSVVYRSYDRVLEREVALKVMRSEVHQYEGVYRHFMQEAKALASLSHPNIVTVFDRGQDAERPYIVMELIKGNTLSAMLRKEGRFSVIKALALTHQLCDGLAYAHEKRLIHRDIKPSNMFVTFEGTVKLADFGLARALDELRFRQTGVRGTPAYMAPEQVLGTDIDWRTDLYAVGCTLYEMLTGRPPFVEGDVTYHQVHTMPLPPSAQIKDISEGVDRLILSCLAKRREERIESANAIREAIEVLLPLQSEPPAGTEPPNQHGGGDGGSENGDQNGNGGMSGSTGQTSPCSPARPG